MKRFSIVNRNKINIFGDFKIYYANCVDCRVGLNKIPDNSIDVIIDDPPYAIGHGKAKIGNYNRDAGNVIEGYNEIDIKDYSSFCDEWIGLSSKKLKKYGTHIVISGWSNQRDILNSAHKFGYFLKNELIFKYNFGLFTKKMLVSSHYDIFIFTKHKSRYTFNKLLHYPEDVFETTEDDAIGLELLRIPREYWKGKEKTPNKLPSELVEMLIMMYSNPGDLIVDNFLGGGTSLEVGHRLGRNVFGFEIQPKYVDFCNNRMQSLLKME